MLFIRFRAIAVAAAAALATQLLVALPASADVAVMVNGSSVDFSSEPIIENGRVFVPLRGVFERLGASVDYANGQITATGSGGSMISLQIGSTQAEVNGAQETLDVAPFIVGDVTFVPLRFVSQALGANVGWDQSNQVVSIDMANAPAPDVNDMVAQNGDDDDNYTDVPPPPIPDYAQPDVPAPNEIWQPGYWAWGSYGYYWVPGTWVEPPQTGYLWTPGYWAWNNNRYAWNAGYWAVSVGFYGGINYGAGYYGNGYVGGRWNHNTFAYNTYVTHVNRTVVQNVYVDRSVHISNTTVRQSYNGGPHGIAVRATPQEQAAAHERHIGMTPVQQQHVAAAGKDRQLLATVNHDRPPVVAVARPLAPTRPAPGYVPVRPTDRVAVHAAPAAAPHNAPVAALHTAPDVHPAPAAAAPHDVAPQHAAPDVHAAPAAAPHYVAPAAAAPHYVAPAMAPQQHAAPAAAPHYAAPAAAPHYVAPAAAPQQHVAPAAAPHDAAPAAAPHYVAPAPAPHYAAPAGAPQQRAPAAAPHDAAPPMMHAAPAPRAARKDAPKPDDHH